MGWCVGWGCRLGLRRGGFDGGGGGGGVVRV